MTGLCGSFGAVDHDIEPLAAGLEWTGREETASYAGGDLSVTLATHTAGTADQPVRTRNGSVSVWTWGTVWGYEGQEYTPTDPDRSAAVCADLYTRYGTEFAERLNGTFVALVADEAEDVLHIVTDRLGTHPLYLASTDDGFVFSTNLQGLAESVDATADDRLMAEYLATGRVSGCATPFEGIEEVPPGTVDTHVLGGSSRRVRYWLPRYRPLDRPYSYFVDEFVDRFRQVVAEYDRPDERHGLLLSGGSDSRLLLATQPSNLTAYHMSDWMSPEATAAERAAHAADVDLEWLRRDRDHHRRALASNSRMMNFYGRFDQAHTTGFEETLGDADVLVSGLYADSLFKGGPLPKRTADFGPLGNLDLPLSRSVDSVESFLSTVDRPLPEYLTVSGSLADLLRPDIRRTDRGIEHRGVVYPSLAELVGCWEFYPMSNDPDLFYYGLTQTMPHWTPFLDNRLVDLSLTMPRKYQLRRNVVNDALDRVAPDLAAIPNARTGTAASRSFAVQFVAARLASIRRRFLPGKNPPKNYFGHGPWTPIDKLLQRDRFGMETIGNAREALERLPFVSWDGALRCYRDHLADGGNDDDLYMLLGLLRMPVTEHLVDRYDRPSTDDDRSPGDASPASERALRQWADSRPGER
ncbi:asparagine synthase [Halomarina salina]|uniref:Asparagine synthase n=1 Tax=Halomarina salina TaxID=1872699 RepID=A0ABD5RKV6_9EURY|nr:asparagine synthase [Halomarina salina]